MAEPLPLPPPLAPVTVRMLVLTLPKICGLVFVEGVLIALDAFVHAIFAMTVGKVSWIPWLGQLVSVPAERIEMNISNRLGTWEQGLDARYGSFFYALSHVVSDLAEMNVVAAVQDTLVAKRITGANSPPLIRKKVATETHTRVAGDAKVKAAIPAAVRPEAKARTHADARQRVAVKSVASTVDGVIEWDIPGLRARTKAVTDRVGRLEKRVAKDARRWGTIAFAGAVAIALARLGVGWARCSNVKRVGRQLCGMNPGWLDALLAGALAILAPISLVTFAHVMLDAMDEITSAVQGFIRETHGVPSRSAAEQGFAAPGGGIAFRSAGDQGLA